MTPVNSPFPLLSPVEKSGVPAAISSFDRAALRYRRHARVQHAMAAWLAEWLPSSRVGRALEIGAGPGVFTEQAMPWHGPFTATDISPAMCDAGRAVLPDIRWRVMPAETPLAGPWDWIFSSSMLQWASQPTELFGAWREQLASRGRILGGLFVAGSLVEVDEFLGDEAPVRWRTASEWREELARAGLRLMRDAVEPRVFSYDSALALWRSLHGVGAVMPRRFGPARLRRLLRDFDARHTSPAGVQVTWMFYRFEVERPGGLTC